MLDFKKNISQLIFMSRWLQLPLYLGLMVVLVVYVFQFLRELGELVMHANHLNDTYIMLGALDLIDVVMIANLIIMVIMAGYETFISPLELEPQSDQPEWLDHVDAGSMKVKLALSLIGISSIHLLRTFIEPSKFDNYAIMWQVIIHATLIISALSIALTNKLLSHDSHRSAGTQERM